MNKHLLGFLIIAFCASSACAAGAAPNKIDSDQAKALVMASLTPKQRQLPSLGADAYNDPNSSKFLFFTVTWAGTPNGALSSATTQ